MSRLVATAVAVLSVVTALSAQQSAPRPQPHGRLFPPQDLGLLEAPDRDIWQMPDRVMDALGIAEASVVADIGAGSGWFTVRLARRVGPNGKVYAEDVQRLMLEAIKRRVDAEGLLNVVGVLGEGSDPQLPRGKLHAVLMVDASEIVDRVTLLRNLARSLRPEGRIGIVDFKLTGGGPGPPTEERVSPEVVARDAANAGLRLLTQENFLPYQYLLVFGLAAK
ncbi:MAG TPA: class I SAM-dependent methyltransferase [Vicinamibacterales bacterium]|nr:class I SAM-dependent methyltransferase [Vicinamibacterales bacterium]